MEVVRDGNINDLENWREQITCQENYKWDTIQGCHAVLEVTSLDAGNFSLMYWFGRHEEKNYYPVVKCPRCGKYIKVTNIPGSIREELYNEQNKQNATFDGYYDT